MKIFEFHENISAALAVTRNNLLLFQSYFAIQTDLTLKLCPLSQTSVPEGDIIDGADRAEDSETSRS